jgi:predicted ATPase
MYRIVKRARVARPFGGVAVRGHVQLDQEYIGAFNIAISDQELVYNDLLHVPETSLDEALFALAIPHLQLLIADGTMPLDEFEGVEIRLRGQDVKGTLEQFADGKLLAAEQFESLSTDSKSRGPRKTATLSAMAISNFYGFAEEQTVEFGRLTVLLGANGSGKTTLLRALAVLQAVAGGVDPTSLVNGRWRNTDSSDEFCRMTVWFDSTEVTYDLGFRQNDGSRFSLLGEHVFETDRGPAESTVLRRPLEDWPLLFRQVEPSGSIADVALPFRNGSALSLCVDERRFPLASSIQACLVDAQVHRGWRFGGGDEIDDAPADRPDDRLRRDGSNLPVVLARILRQPNLRSEFEEELREVLPGAETIRVVEGTDRVRVGLTLFGKEFGLTELSDGTKLWLQLLTVLLDPNPAAIVAFDEPELGLHPEMMPALARLLKKAATRTQIVIATHEPLLLDALAEIEAPWSVVAFELTGDGIQVTVPNLDEIRRNWLGQGKPPAGLGEVWARGALGGTRW